MPGSVIRHTGLQTALLLRSGAHVLDVRSAPVLENHRFRLGLTNSQREQSRQIT